VIQQVTAKVYISEMNIYLYLLLYIYLY